MKKTRPLFMIFLLALALPVLAQTPPSTNASSVATENDTINAGPTSQMQACGYPANASPQCTAIVTVPSSAFPLTPTWTGSNSGYAATVALFGPADPSSGNTKYVSVIETSAIQTFTVTRYGQSASTTVTIPAAVATVVAVAPPPPPPPPVAASSYSPSFVPGTVYAAVLTPTVLASSTAANLLTALSIPSAQLVAGVLQNFTYALTFNGVPFSCTFGTLTTTGGAISLNCIPAPVATSAP
jgi:hypothetical protein